MTAEVEVILNASAVNEMLHSEHGMVGRYMTRLMNNAGNKARAYAKVDTGLMRSRTEGYVTTGPDGLEGRLVSRTNYARYINSGTRYITGDHFLNRAAAEAVREATRL